MLLTSTDFNKKFYLKNQATPNTNVKEAITKLRIIINLHMKDSNFTLQDGVVNIHQFKGTHLTEIFHKLCFNSFGCVPPNIY